MKTYELLEKALGEIEDPQDWFQGAYSGPAGAVCAEGACNKVQWGTVLPSESGTAEAPLFNVLGLAILSRGEDGNLAEFNDSHSHAEVVALFQQVIAEEKRKVGVFIKIPSQPEKVPA